MLTNYHTHHQFCLHAIGKVEDYVKKAIEENYEIIGISDHAPFPHLTERRMSMDQFTLYFEEIKACKLKYGNQIKILSALETEFFDEYIDYYKELNQKLDYLILAPHDFIYQGKMCCAFFIKSDRELIAYFETLIRGIKTKLFNFAAHPDLFMHAYHFSDVAKEYTHKLAKVCIEEDFILEFNANGFRKGKREIMGEYRYPYPYMPFWDIISTYQVKVIVNSDCHDPSYLNDEYDQYAKDLAIKSGMNVVSTI